MVSSRVSIHTVNVTYMAQVILDVMPFFFFSSRRRHTRCALVTGVQTGALPISEPKILSGTNFCDVGFEADPHSNRVVALSAIDKLGRASCRARVCPYV